MPERQPRPREKTAFAESRHKTTKSVGGVALAKSSLGPPSPKLPVPTVGRRSERSRTPFRRSPFGTVAKRLLHSGTAVTLVERWLVTSVTSVTTFARNRIHAIHILWQLNSARLSCTPISDPYSRTALTLRTTAQSAVQQNNTYTYIAHYTRPCMASLHPNGGCRLVRRRCLVLCKQGQARSKVGCRSAAMPTQGPPPQNQDRMNRSNES